MRTDGVGNRVAQRDYYELPELQSLFVAQIQESGIVPCPTCECRFIQIDRKECRHCTEKREKEEALNALAAAGVAAFALFCIGFAIAKYFGAEGGAAFEMAAGISFLLFLILAGLYFAVWAWIDCAPTQEAASRRYSATWLSSCALGVVCILFATQPGGEVVNGWVFGFGFIPLFFGALLMRRKPRILAGNQFQQGR